MAGPERIELPPLVSKTSMISISLKTDKLVEDGRIELPLHACKAHVLPLSLIPQKLVSVAGIEPTLYRPKRQVIPFHHTEIFILVPHDRIELP